MKNEKLVRYFKLDQEIKGLKPEHEELNKEIKAFMKDGNTRKLTVQNGENGSIVFAYNPQERVSMNEVKLLRKVKEAGFLEAVEMVEAVNVKKVEDLIFSGALPASFLEDCIDKKIVETLTAKEGK